MMAKKEPLSQWDNLTDEEKVDFLIPLTTRWHQCLDTLMNKKVNGVPLMNREADHYSVLKSVEVALNTYRDSLCNKNPYNLFAKESADFVIDYAPYGYRTIQQFEEFLERNTDDTFLFDVLDIQVSSEVILKSLNYITVNRLDGGPSRKYDVTKIPTSYRKLEDGFLKELLMVGDE